MRLINKLARECCECLSHRNGGHFYICCLVAPRDKTKGPVLWNSPGLPPQFASLRIQINYAENAFCVIGWTRSKEELVGSAVVRISAAKIDGPELVNVDGISAGVADRAHEGAGERIECIDRAG